ncbi:hypothetical protein POV27_06395 [Aureisphaera galaxeae]|uniref:hypothetical protein n=1 Tax=Aureisphaera galaxeae TaxID=1538023 RepID=UPI002350214D|nr:hypothetical protein [Aureisphaera galaxeae]MDC8003672.1 hypothetical protein [Aureisphaera galaxeae]
MEPLSTVWHFPIMILASLLLFFVIIALVIGKLAFQRQSSIIIILSLFVVVVGMLFGKYGAQWGLPWWVYYPVPMLMTVLLPPVVLKMRTRQTVFYLVLSFLSAPLIHVLFSFFLGWQEYMPFLDIPYIGDLF